MTVLELLMALILLVGIATMLLSATQLSVRSYQSVTEISAQTTPAAQRLQLRRWLSTAIAPTLLTTFDKPFEGTSERLTFTTLAPVGFAADSAALKLTIQTEESGLTLDISPIDDDGNTLRTLTRTLSEAAGPLRLDYLTRTPEGAPHWLPAWEEDTRLPLAVRIRKQTGEDKLWPDFVVALTYAAP